jgi:hypothetical protein
MQEKENSHSSQQGTGCDERRNSINLHQQAPTSTNKHQQASTCINLHQHASTRINKHQQASTSINMHLHLKRCPLPLARHMSHARM